MRFSSPSITDRVMRRLLHHRRIIILLVVCTLQSARQRCHAFTARQTTSHAPTIQFHSLDNNLRSSQLFYLPSENTNHNNDDLPMAVDGIGDDRNTRPKIVRITNHEEYVLFYKKMIKYALLNSTPTGARVVKSLESNIVI